MSCYFAIPSVRDVEDGGFRRIGRWNQMEQVIRFDSDGSATLAFPANIDFTGVIIVSPYFF